VVGPTIANVFRDVELLGDLPLKLGAQLVEVLPILFVKPIPVDAWVGYV
jgi:hypothetical protein